MVCFCVSTRVLYSLYGRVIAEGDLMELKAHFPYTYFVTKSLGGFRPESMDLMMDTRRPVPRRAALKRSAGTSCRMTPSSPFSTQFHDALPTSGAPMPFAVSDGDSAVGLLSESAFSTSIQPTTRLTEKPNATPAAAASVVLHFGSTATIAPAAPTPPFDSLFATPSPIVFGASADQPFSSGVVLSHEQRSRKSAKSIRARPSKGAARESGTKKESIGSLSGVSASSAAHATDLAGSLAQTSLAETKVNRYEKWGGLAAVVASCDDFKSVHISDHDLWVLLSKLDIMDRAGRTLKDVMEAWRQCAFTCEEVNRLNSAVLDGLWYAFNNQPVVGQGATCIADDPSSILEMLSRLVQCKAVAYLDAMKYLLDRCDNFPDEAVCSLFYEAFQSQQLPIVELLVSRGFLDLYDQTLVCEAVSGGSADIVRFLVDKGLSVNQDCVTRAAAFGRTDLLSLLLEGPDAPSHRLELPLRDAIRGDHVDAVKWLIDRGAPVIVEEPNIFNWAISCVALRVLSHLIERGLRTDHRTPDVVDLKMSSRREGVAVLEILTKAGLHNDELSLTSSLRLAIDADNVDAVRFILSTNLLPQPAISLHLPRACHAASPATVRLLLDAGADVHLIDDYEEDPLQMALLSLRPEWETVRLVSLLLERGAPVHWLRNETYCAEMRRFRPRVVELLFGAELDVAIIPVGLIVQALQHCRFEIVSAFLRTHPPPALPSDQRAQLLEALDANDADRVRLILQQLL